MTEPRDMHRERETEATKADVEPQVKPEVIKDLDMAGDDVDAIGGGVCFTSRPDADVRRQS